MNLRRAAPFVRQHRSSLFVVKLGGSCLARHPARAHLAEEIALVDALGARVVVVHGAGPQTDALQRSFGEEPRKLDGRRVTTPLALRALRLATLGELNAELALALEQHGARAVGLAAATGGILVAERRPSPSAAAAASGEALDFGAVGDVVSADPRALLALLDAGFVPVVAPPASDGAGGFLNVNADLAAAHVARALDAEKLVLVTDRPGILADPGDPASVLSTLDLAGLERLARGGVLADGMRVKAEAIRVALEGGVRRVHVVSGIEPDALLGELYTTEGTGTLVERGLREAPAASAPAVPAEVAR